MFACRTSLSDIRYVAFGANGIQQTPSSATETSNMIPQDQPITAGMCTVLILVINVALTDAK